MAIVCKSAAEIEKMRKSGRIVRQVLDHLRTLVHPGVSTMDLERAAEQKMKDLNCDTIEAAMKMVEGSARSMGIQVGE